MGRQNEVPYQNCTIQLAPSYTDPRTWICGYSVVDASGRVAVDGHIHGPFTTAERAKRGRYGR